MDILRDPDEVVVAEGGVKVVVRDLVEVVLDGGSVEVVAGDLVKIVLAGDGPEAGVAKDGATEGSGEDGQSLLPQARASSLLIPSSLAASFHSTALPEGRKPRLVRWRMTCSNNSTRLCGVFRATAARYSICIGFVQVIMGKTISAYSLTRSMSSLQEGI